MADGGAVFTGESVRTVLKQRLKFLNWSAADHGESALKAGPKGSQGVYERRRDDDRIRRGGDVEQSAINIEQERTQSDARQSASRFRLRRRR